MSLKLVSYGNPAIFDWCNRVWFVLLKLKSSAGAVYKQIYFQKKYRVLVVNVKHLPFLSIPKGRELWLYCL